MNAQIVDDTRWTDVQARGLDKGNHDSIASGMCAMEAAAYIAREPWSDHPQCVDVGIAAFMRSWNDALPDDQRHILLPLIPLTVGTAGSEKLAERRAMMAVDWYIRVHTPAWLKLAGLDAQATTLAALPEITDTAQMPSLRGPLEAVRQDASAAWSAARLAAESAAWSAARSVMVPVVAEIQLSAADLVRRMCALNEIDLSTASVA